jgi:hypothetical protein
MDSIGKKADFDTKKVIFNHSTNILPYLHRQFDKTIVGLGERHYQIIDPRNGDGYYQTKLRWSKNLKMIQDYLQDDYEFNIE